MAPFFAKPKNGRNRKTAEKTAEFFWRSFFLFFGFSGRKNGRKNGRKTAENFSAGPKNGAMIFVFYTAKQAAHDKKICPEYFANTSLNTQYPWVEGGYALPWSAAPSSIK